MLVLRKVAQGIAGIFAIAGVLWLWGFFFGLICALWLGLAALLYVHWVVAVVLLVLACIFMGPQTGLGGLVTCLVLVGLAWLFSYPCQWLMQITALPFTSLIVAAIAAGIGGICGVMGFTSQDETIESITHAEAIPLIPPVTKKRRNEESRREENEVIDIEFRVIRSE